MSSAMDILYVIEEQKPQDVKQLAKRLGISLDLLKEILTYLSKHDLIEYNAKTGQVLLPTWLANIERKIDEIKPPTGAIILPRNGEVRIEDVAIGNFTKKDLELKIRLRARLKEIAICDFS
jgi:hypothetical protein